MNPVNPALQQGPSQLFSKGSLVITMQQGPPPMMYLVFVLMNVYDLRQEKIGEKNAADLINEVLDRLNLTEETIPSITFTFTTRFPSTNGTPASRLTNLINKKFIEEITKSTNSESMSAFSIRLGDKFPIEKDGTNLVFEPLVTEPEKIFLMQYIRKFKSRNVLVELFDSFPKMLPGLMSGVDPLD